MKSDFEYDKELWFELEEKHCEGKHYIVGNPHTFNGRISAYCPQKDVLFNVTPKEIVEMPLETKCWIKGFLSGNEHSPPVVEEGDLYQPTHDEYIRWEQSIELFHKTGYWYAGDRDCEICGKKLLNYWTGFECDNCLGKE